MNTGLPRHFTVTVWPSWMFFMSTSRLAMASTSCGVQGRVGDSGRCRLPDEAPLMKASRLAETPQNMDCLE